jgi:prophage regulatory protein
VCSSAANFEQPQSQGLSMNSPIRILRVQEVQNRVGFSRPSIYRRLDNASKSYDPSFPRPIQLGANSVGWIEAEINVWLEARVRASRGGEQRSTGVGMNN